MPHKERSKLEEGEGDHADGFEESSFDQYKA